MLVFWGLRVSFNAGDGVHEVGLLMAALAGYTLLLAATAWFLIRFGNVWQDVRTVLLLVVLMFMAISLTFEESLLNNRPLGTLCLLGGLVFAMLLSEALLRGIRLRLPAMFRVPYHLLLVLFFLYPIALNPTVADPNEPALLWGLFGFAPLAGLLFLTLLPAVRRGPQYVAENGSPWRWPLYPWVLFGVLGFGVLLRSYALCMSCYPMPDSANIFGLYFLVPFLLAVNVLLLEIGLVSRSRSVMQVALITPIALVALAAAGPGDNTAARHFFEVFRNTLGTYPLLGTLLAVAVFYAVAACRRVPHAATALTATLAVTLVCGPRTFDVSSLVPLQGVALLSIAAVQLAVGFRRRSSVRCFAAVCCGVAGLCLELYETPFMAYRGLIPVHLLLAATLLIGATLGGRFVKRLQLGTAAAIVLLGAVAVFVDPMWLGDPPKLLLSVYPMLSIASAAAYGYLVHNRWHYAAAATNLGTWTSIAGWQTYLVWRRTVAGLDQIVCGVLFFLLAAAISLLKTGLPQRGYDNLRKRLARLFERA